MIAPTVNRNRLFLCGFLILLLGRPNTIVLASSRHNRGAVRGSTGIHTDEKSLRGHGSTIRALKRGGEKIGHKGAKTKTKKIGVSTNPVKSTNLKPVPAISSTQDPVDPVPATNTTGTSGSAVSSRVPMGTVSGRVPRVPDKPEDTSLVQPANPVTEETSATYGRDTIPMGTVSRDPRDSGSSLVGSLEAPLP